MTTMLVILILVFDRVPNRRHAMWKTNVRTMANFIRTQRNRVKPDVERIPNLVAILAEADPARREWARKSLVVIGRPAVPLLIECMSDHRRQVRWEAAKALGSIIDPAATQALVEGLEDDDADVRWLSAQGLIALRRRALRPLLLALLARPESDWLREGAHHVCRDLARTKMCREVQTLLKALDEHEPQVSVPVVSYAMLVQMQERDIA